jgi:hypothetical protein
LQGADKVDILKGAAGNGGRQSEDANAEDRPHSQPLICGLDLTVTVDPQALGFDLEPIPGGFKFECRLHGMSRLLGYKCPDDGIACRAASRWPVELAAGKSKRHTTRPNIAKPRKTGQALLPRFIVVEKVQQRCGKKPSLSGPVREGAIFAMGNLAYPNAAKRSPGNRPRGRASRMDFVRQRLAFSRIHRTPAMRPERKAC